MQKKEGQNLRGPLKGDDLSVQEAEILSRSLLLATGGKATEEEFERIIRWASEVKLEYGMLDLVLKGLISVRAGKDDIEFQLAPDLEFVEDQK